MNKTKKLFSNSATGIAARFLNAFLQILALPILLNTYGKNGYGLIAIAMSLNTLMILLQLGLPTGIPKFVAEWYAKKDLNLLQKASSTVLSFYLFIAVINFLVIMVVRYFFAHYFKIAPEQLVTFKELLTITALFSFISIPINFLDQLLSGVQEIAFISRQQMVKNLLFAGLVLYVHLRPQGLTLIQFYTLNCLTMVALVPSKVRRWLKYGAIQTLIPRLNFKETVPLLKYCLHLFIMGVFIMAADKLKPLILSIRTTGDAAMQMADYQIIYNFVIFFSMISSSVIAALVPYISREYVLGNLAIYKKIIQDVTKPVWALGALMVSLIVLLSKEILIVYVGAHNLYLQKWFILFLIGGAYLLYTVGISAVVLASGKTLPYTIGTAFAAAISLVVCWLFIPTIAIGGMVYAYLIYVGIIFAVVHFYYLKRVFNVSPIWQIFMVFLPPVIAAIVMNVCMHYFFKILPPRINPYITIMIGLVMGSAIYLTLILKTYLKPRGIQLFLSNLNHE